MISLFLLHTAPTNADAAHATTLDYRIYHLQQQQNQEVNTVFKHWAQVDVLYLAETHDRLEDHQAQLAILRSLHRQRPQIVIAMEMFQRPYQTELDRYLSGRMGEEELIQRTEYSKRWGYPWEFYAPILQFAKEQRLPVVALNTPSEVTRKVARTGLDSLTSEEQQWIPPRSTILLEPQCYRQRVQQIYDDIHQSKGNSSEFERFFQAQVLWDETMADGITTALRQHPNSLVVVLTGQGHILYGDGIPNRVARRMDQHRSRSLRQVSVVLNPPAQLEAEPTIADYFLYSPAGVSDDETGGNR